MSDRKQIVDEVTRDLLPDFQVAKSWDALTEDERKSILRGAKDLLSNDFFKWFSGVLIYTAGQKIIRHAKTDVEIAWQRGGITYIESIAKRANALLENSKNIKQKTE